jgi:molybdopterin synthase catalytic subunit
MRVRVQDAPLEPWRELGAAPKSGSYGATSVFVGTLRDFNQGHDVEQMTLEHYPGMTESYLQQISEEAAGRWDLVDTLVIHRVGRLHPGEPIVLVAVWAARRDDAFSACRYIIDELKTRAPFWKKETTDEGPRWVTPGDA